MPSANTGKKTIKSIKVYKDHVTLSFVRSESIKISKEAFLSTYLYEGKTISRKEIDNLLDITALSKHLNYALSLLSKRHYSEKQIREKLKAKEASYNVINSIINKLKENDLLDDRAYMEDLIAWDQERKFGKNKIIKHLREQGIPDNLIAKASFSDSNELKKAKALVIKLEAKYARYAYEIKKKHVYQALISKGFSPSISKEASELVKSGSDKNELEKVKIDYLKIKKRYEKKYEGYELKQKIYAALLNKGYKNSSIKNVLGGFNDENDF